MSEAHSPIHESLLPDEEQSTVNIETTVDVIKPVFGYGRKLVSEAKIHVDNGGIRYNAVDPANVCMVGLDVPAEAFESYETDGTIIGLDLKTAMGSLRAGRQKSSDEIRMAVEGDRLNTTISRDYSGTQMDLQNRIRVIDPDSIRQEPDIPELDLPAKATVPRMLFDDVVNQINTYTDYLEIESDGTDLIFDGMGDTKNTRAVVPGVVENDEGDVNSAFSLDYIKDSLKAFAAIGADELTFTFGEEFPVRIEFTTELNGAEVSGSWFQAPRIQSE